MKREAIILAAACAAALFIGPASASAGALEQATLREINKARAEHDLGRLQAHSGLAAAAEDQSQWMAAHDVLGHRYDLLDRLRSVTPSQDVWGETVAWMPGGRATMARRTVRAWLRSPPHREILLMAPLQLAGIAEATGDDGVFITADFAG
jgi:uncharacterized protein YkwD